MELFTDMRNCLQTCSWKENFHGLQVQDGKIRYEVKCFAKSSTFLKFRKSKNLYMGKKIERKSESALSCLCETGDAALLGRSSFSCLCARSAVQASLVSSVLCFAVVFSASVWLGTCLRRIDAVTQWPGRGAVRKQTALARLHYICASVLQRRWAPGTERCFQGAIHRNYIVSVVVFTLRVIKTRVSDRFYSYGQENRLLTGSPSAANRFR